MIDTRTTWTSKHVLSLICFTLLLTLAACGGGGSDSAGNSDDWCVPGDLMSSATADVVTDAHVQEARVVGMTEYKDKSYCKAEYAADLNGRRTTLTVYFNQGMSAGWVVTDLSGQVMEYPFGGGA